MDKLKGYRTYIALALSALMLVAVNAFGLSLPGVSPDPNWGNHLVELLAGAFLRAGVANKGV